MVTVISEAAYSKVWDPASGLTYRVRPEPGSSRYIVDRLDGVDWYGLIPSYATYKEAERYAVRRILRTLQARRRRSRIAARKAQP